jgi:hypothetical protein
MCGVRSPGARIFLGRMTSGVSTLGSAPEATDLEAVTLADAPDHA